MYHKIKRYVVVFMFLLLGCLIGSCAPSSQLKKVPADSDEAFREPNDDLMILTIGTADSGGTMYPVGSAIAQAISGSDQRIKVNISASNGSLTNLEALKNGQIDLGLVSGDVAFCAYNGTEEFSGKANTNVRAIAAVYSSLSNWMAPDSLGITYVHELAGKRISVGPKNSTTELSAQTALASLGLNASNTTLQNYGLGSGGNEIEKGNVDAIHGFAGIPIAGLTQLSEKIPSRLLQYTNEELNTILSQNLYYYQTTIPAGTYQGQASDVKTFGVKCLICVDESASEELVYTLTKILDESRPQLIKSHETMRPMEQISFMCQDLPIPLHPGAKRYYKDVGALSK